MGMRRQVVNRETSSQTVASQNVADWRRTQDAFLARSRRAIESVLGSAGGGISPEELLRRMDERIHDARKQLDHRLGNRHLSSPKA